MMALSSNRITSRFGRITRAIVSVVLSLVAAQSARATGTGNAFVWGEVQDGTGLVTIYTAPGPVGGERLSYREKSYLTVRIGSTKIYTNNNWVLGQPNVFALTTGGSLSIHKCTSGETGDTVRCIWSDKDGVDIIQDVWPVAFDRYGQVVISVKFKNKTGAGVNVQAQYLLDTEPANDKSKVLTKWSFSPKWQVYPNGIRTLPELFMTFQNPLPFPAAGPGITGVGYFDWPGAPLYLIKPTRVTIGDWASNLSGTVWGTQSPMPNTDYGDSGILMEFPGTSVIGGKTVEAMRTSYGTDDWIPCTGKLFTLTKYPHKLTYNGVAYNPNPFKVQTFVCNTDGANSSANTNMRLTVGPNLTITGPVLPAPPTIDGSGHSTQIQPAGSGGNIPPLDVAYVEWTVNAALYAPCTGDLDTWLTLTATTSLGSPAITGCDLPLTLPCTNLADLTPPIIANFVPLSSTNNDSQSFTIQDANPPASNKGLHWPISWVANPVSNFDVYVEQFTDCWTGLPKRVDIQMKDTCIGGTVTFHITDCAGNATDTVVIFPKLNCYHPLDSIPPMIDVVNPPDDCKNPCVTVNIRDNKYVDEVGLKFIGPSPSSLPVNMTLNVPSFQQGDRTVIPATICVTDTMQDGQFTLLAIDTTGKSTEFVKTFCTTADINPPEVKLDQPQVGPHIYTWHASDFKAWDRGLKGIVILKNPTFPDNNLTLTSSGPTPTGTHDSAWIDLACSDKEFAFTLAVTDTTKKADICVYAVDCADHLLPLGRTTANVSPLDCKTWPPLQDFYAPNINITGNCPKVTIDINDIHYYAMPPTEDHKIGADRGIDSIWFTGVTGWTIPDSYKDGFVNNCAASIPPFEVYVTDTLGIDLNPCFTVHARDCGIPNKNVMVSQPFCCTIPGDVSAPVVTGAYTTGTGYAGVNILATETGAGDRGLWSMDAVGENLTDPSGNPFTWKAPVTSPHGDPTITANLKRDPAHSTKATFRALDYWGEKVPADVSTHVSNVPINIWVQGLYMKKSFFLNKDGDFEIPVYFDSTDDRNKITIAEKKLNKVAMFFQLVGDPSMTFKGVRTTYTDEDGKPNSTATTGWIPFSSQSGTTITAGVQAPDGSTFLTGKERDLVMSLVFTGAKIDKTAQTSVVFVNNPATGYPVTYNDGIDVVANNGNATVTLPAPYGALGTSNFAMQGTCATAVWSGTGPFGPTTSAKPTAVSLDPIQPNPFRGEAIVRYTVPVAGTVKLELYNNLGAKVRTLVSEPKAQGAYELKVSTSDLAQGTLYVRLETAGKVITRSVRHE